MTGRRAAVRALTAAGVLGLAVSVAVEVLDAEPHAQLWLGSAAGVAFLLAVPWVRRDDAAGLRDRARLLVGAGVSTVLAVLGLWQATERTEPRVLTLLAPAALLFVTAALALREASLLGARVRAAEARSRLRGEESERRRWAGELHDETLQGLAAVEVRLAGLLAAHRGGDAGPELTAVRDLVHEQITTLRHLLGELRPLTLDTLGLAAAVRELAARTEDVAEVSVTCDVAALPGGLLPDAQVAVYRIVQEALTNAVRHSGCAHVEVVARRDADRLRLAVRDDGSGLPAGAATGPRGHGRLGILDRATAFGGTVSWSPRPGGGTEVAVELPLAEVLVAGP